MKRNDATFVAFRPFRYSPVVYTHINYCLMVLLLPAVLQGMQLYGFYTVRVISGTIAASLFSDAVLERLFGRKSRLYDGSAALTGMLLGMLLPPLTPWWLLCIASASAVFLGRQLFGGAGGSPFNAVCIGWAVVMVSWPELVSPTYGAVTFNLPFSIEYPLAELRRLGPDALELFPAGDLLAGRQVASVGTAASGLLLIGGIVGILLGIIPWIIPVSFLAGTALTALLFSPDGTQMTAMPFFHLCTGFTAIGAFFLASDFSSRPVSSGVMVWYGAVAGVGTVLFRMWSIFPEGLPFALLLVNMTVPLLDRGSMPDGKPGGMVRV